MMVKQLLRRLGFTALLLAAAGFCLGPLIWQIITSVTPETELTEVPPLLPSKATLAHYRAVLFETSLPQALLNSALVASFTTFFALIIGSLAGFALAKLPIRGKNLMLAMVLCISMFPQIATISPLYLIVNSFGLRDSKSALVGAYATFSLPLSIWIMTGFFRALPNELLYAARIDGCSSLQAFTRVALPLTAPAYVSAAILIFIFSWNEFILALTFTVTEASRTVPVEVALFPGLHHVPWGEIAAASIIITVPIAVLVFVFQRRIVEGMTAGATKG